MPKPKNQNVRLSPIASTMLKEMSGIAYDVIEAICYNQEPFRLLYEPYIASARELALIMDGKGPYIGISNLFMSGIQATFEKSGFNCPISNHKELLVMTEFQRWLDGRQQTYKITPELEAYLSEDIKDLSIDSTKDKESSGYMKKCLRLIQSGFALTSKAKEGCKDSRKKLGFVNRETRNSYEEFVTADVWELPFPENFEFVNSDPYVFAFEDGIIFVAPIIRPNAKTTPINKAGLYWDEFPQKLSKSSLQRIFRSHGGRAYSIFHRQDAFYLTMAMFKNPETDGWRQTISHIAPNKSDNTANPYRTLLCGRLITALNCKKTIVRREKCMRRTRVNKNKPSRVSPFIHTIKVDAETLERVRTVSFSDPCGGGHTLPAGERCATKSKQWVLKKNLKEGEEVIASRTNISGNKVFLVKRDRRKVFYNQHLPSQDRDDTPNITTMKLWNEKRIENKKKDRT